MNQFFKIAFTAVLLLMSAVIVAQNGKKTPQLFFQNKELIPQSLTKEQLLPQLQQRLWMTDSSGRMLPVSQYTLTFVERGLYYDEAGKPMIVADYYEKRTQNGIIDSNWINLLEERLKMDDTIKIINPIVYIDIENDIVINGPTISIPISK